MYFKNLRARNPTEVDHVALTLNEAAYVSFLLTSFFWMPFRPPRVVSCGSIHLDENAVFH